MSFLKSLVKTAGKAVGGVIHVQASVVMAPGKLMAKGLKHVPIVGKPLATTINLAQAPMRLVDSIAKGDRVDQAVIANIKSQVRDVKEVGPYAQMVLSVVPGVGTVASGAIGAGIALASGQPITKAIVAGVKGAIPGGPIAQSAFNVAEAAVNGKSLTQIGISALPLDPNQKKAVTATLNFAVDVAKGKRVDKAALENAQKALPPDVRKALTVGLAVAQGRKVQLQMLANVTPDVINKLVGQGTVVIGKSATLQAGLKMASPQGQKGFRVGAAIMQYQLTPIEAVAIRKKLSPEEQKGFDLAAAGVIGMVATKDIKAPVKALPSGGTAKPTAKEKFGFAATHGVVSGSNAMKTEVLKTTIKGGGTAGTVSAAKSIAQQRRGWWHRFMVWLELKKD